MKIKTIIWRLKDDAFPELKPESREAIIGAEKAMCEENAAYGYVQGLRNGMIFTAAGVTGIALTTIGLRKLKKKSKSQKKD